MAVQIKKYFSIKFTVSMLDELKRSFDRSSQMALVTDDAGNPEESRLLYISDALLQELGYDRNTLTDFDQIYSRLNDPSNWKRFVSAMREKKVVSEHLLLERASGGLLWTEVSLLPLYDDKSGDWCLLHKFRPLEENELIRFRQDLLKHSELPAEMNRIGFWEWYPNGDRTFFSSSVYQILGLDADYREADLQLLKKHMIPKDQSLLDDLESRALDGVEELPVHSIIRQDTQEERYVKGYLNRRENDNGLLKIYGIIQDVTVFQKQLRETRIFRQAIESSNSGITISDMTKEDNPLMYVNQRFLNMTGYDKSEVSGQNCRFLQGSDRQQDARFELQEAVEKGESRRVIMRNYTKEGELFWNRLSIAPIRDQEGAITNYVGVQEDITDEVQLQAELKESERMWRNLVEVNPELIAIIKGDEISFINEAGANIFGAESAEVVEGRPAADLIHPDFREKSKERMKKLGNGESTDFYTYRINSFDEKERYLRTRSLPVRIGNEQAILTVGQDVTKQYMNQAKLEKLNEQKQTLIQEIHHRVKNNMAIISGLLDLQKEEVEDPDAIDALANSQLRLETMAKVHEQMYEEQDLTDIPSDEYLAKLLETIQEAHSTEYIKIEQDIESFLLNVNQAIPLGLLMNELIVNAYQHAFWKEEEGKISVELSLEDDQVYGRVSDNGQGMPEELDLEQPDSLGFTLIQTLAQQLRADLEVESNENGAAISFTFDRDKLQGSASNIDDIEE